MSEATSPELVCSAHVCALVEIVRADACALGMHVDEVTEMCMTVVSLAMHRLTVELNRVLLEGSLAARTEAVCVVLQEASALLEVAPIAQTAVATDLRLLERLCVLVLDELGAQGMERSDPEAPF